MREALTDKILGVLGQKYPHWQQVYGNAHTAILWSGDIELDDLRNQWLLTETGQRYLACRDKWELLWDEQRRTRERSFDRAYRLWDRQDQGQELRASEKSFLAATLGDRHDSEIAQDAV
jgi:hypothetical protein